MASYSIGTVWDATQRVLRTIVQVGIPAFLTFNLLVPQLIDALGGVLPEGAILWLNGAAAVITAVAAALSKIMAIPAVNDWLAKFKLSTVPPATAEKLKA